MVLLKSIFQDGWCNDYENLHSTMVLLKFALLLFSLFHNIHLHSTMVLLKLKDSDLGQSFLVTSTFHYGSIKIPKRIISIYY